ncbi:hypothetical protein [Algoriphagus confluentis]|uniref:Uncharacterized protein n=1 Tax=Algoriphagus confluentis TaxID=1697556 RepID=A0ABQ6PNT4_9BACT|nr:hypothetical protein Aconfl_20610 [Algoriphagus confluentis]
MISDFWSGGLDILIIFVPKYQVLDHSAIVKSFRDSGKVTIKEGNSHLIQLVKPELWEAEGGNDGVFLLFDLFQIRSVCVPFSEVSLDIVDFSSKPTIFHSPVNPSLSAGPIDHGEVKFSLIREPHWNKLLFQLSQPVVARTVPQGQADHQVTVFFPLLMKGVKEMFLGPEGEVKIRKG